MPDFPRYNSTGQMTTQKPQPDAPQDAEGAIQGQLAKVATEAQGAVVKWDKAVRSMRNTQAEFNLKSSVMALEEKAQNDPDPNNYESYEKEIDKAYEQSGAADTEAQLQLKLLAESSKIRMRGEFRKKAIYQDRGNTADIIAMHVANPVLGGRGDTMEYIKSMMQTKVDAGTFNEEEAQKVIMEADKDIRMNAFLRDFRSNPKEAEKKFEENAYGFTVETAEKARVKMKEINRMNRESQTANVADASLRIFSGDLTENEINAGIEANRQDASLGWTEKQGATLKQALYRDVKARIGAKEYEKQKKAIDYIFSDSQQDKLTMYEAVLNAYKDGINPEEAGFLKKIVDAKKDIVFANKAAAGKKFLETLLGAKAKDVGEQTRNLLIYAQRISAGASPESAAQETAFDIVKGDHPAVVGDPDLAGTFSPTKGFRPVTKVKRDESSTGKGR